MLRHTNEDFVLKVDQYLNGFYMQNKFFSFLDEKNLEYFTQMKIDKCFDEKVFEAFTVELRPQITQKQVITVREFGFNKEGEAVLHSFIN